MGSRAHIFFIAYFGNFIHLNITRICRMAEWSYGLNILSDTKSQIAETVIKIWSVWLCVFKNGLVFYSLCQQKNCFVYIKEKSNPSFTTTSSTSLTCDIFRSLCNPICLFDNANIRYRRIYQLFQVIYFVPKFFCYWLF